MVICSYDAVCPLGPESVPSGGTWDKSGDAERQYAPIVDGEDAWVNVGRDEPCTKYSPEAWWNLAGVDHTEVVRHVACCFHGPGEGKPSDAEVAAVAAEADAGERDEGKEADDIALYDPRLYDRDAGYEGSTYREAIRFCDSEGKRRICPLNSICPTGKSESPLGGLIPGGKVYVPILDDYNDWVQIGDAYPAPACIPWSGMHPNPPEWGEAGGESSADKVYCCVVSDGEVEKLDGGTALAEEVAAMADSAELSSESDVESPVGSLMDSVFNPSWFDRLSGWTGKTYLQALSFCATFDSAIICPYRVYCPDGENSTPHEGVKTSSEGGTELWAPTGDASNSWVQVGPKNSCVLYSSMHSDPPKWGLNDNDVQDMTSHIMCCEVDKGTGNVIGPQQGSAEVLQQDIPPEADAHSTDEEIVAAGDPTLNAIVLEQFHPEAYDRSSGWDGQTYAEAVTFCKNKSEAFGLKRSLCPFQAYCPHGPRDVPYGGLHSGSNWAPVSDGFNWWVQTGKTSNEGPCTFYKDVYGYHPQPEMMGEWLDNWVTENIMCCDAEEDTSVVDMRYEAMIDKYKPIWFHRDDWSGTTHAEATEFCHAINLEVCAYEAICPGGPDAPLFDSTANIQEPSGSWAPLSGVNDWWGMEGGKEELTRHIVCCVPQTGTALVHSDMEIEVMNKYQPQWYDRENGWEGVTYADAVEYCSSVNQILCPIEAYCPDGNGQLPFGVAAARQSTIDLSSYSPAPIDGQESWGPVADDYNEWVKLDTQNVCALYTFMHPNKPNWGTKGAEDITRHVLCCDPSAPITVATANVDEDPAETSDSSAGNLDGLIELLGYGAIVDKYKPVWFHRDDWSGSTYPEATAFCHAQSLEICDYEAICPGGPNGHLFDMMTGFQEPFGSWAPLSDYNDWVSVDTELRCIKWSAIKSSPPQWGTKDGDEGLTRHIVCCLPRIETEASELAVYDPKWYGRNDGWIGTTYGEAVDFCSSANRLLCPAEAYCPDGNGALPFSGDSSPPLDEGVFWGPVADDINEWVKLDQQNVCSKYSAMHPEKPDWGTTGQEDITRHVLCCDENAPITLATANIVATITAPTTSDANVPTDVTAQHDEMGPRPKPAASHATTTTTTKATTRITTATTTLATTIKAVPGVIDAVAPDSLLVSNTLQEAKDKYFARWHNWNGNTYGEAIRFCAGLGSKVPCPYEVYCPMGPGPHVTGGVRDTETYSPMIDTANGWVSVGPRNTCMPYNADHATPPEWGLTVDGNEEITREILCCSEPENGIGLILADEPLLHDYDTAVEQRSDSEQRVLDNYHPIWYDVSDGYHGTTHPQAEDFCKNIAGSRLCPLEAYCPNGNQNGEGPLFLDRPPFEGEQWAPFGSSDPATIVDSELDWVLIGTIGGDPATSCGTYESLANMATWKASGSPSTRKSHVLCCTDEDANLEDIVKQVFDPTWYDEGDGWNGGSYEDATSFCGQRQRELCKYMAYCPHGDGKPGDY
ncbi:hypothetical protein ACHAWF_016232 [Thalassiosira exigua]